VLGSKTCDFDTIIHEDDVPNSVTCFDWTFKCLSVVWLSIDSRTPKKHIFERYWARCSKVDNHFKLNSQHNDEREREREPFNEHTNLQCTLIMNKIVK
jgi:hypothetical protein